METMELSAGRLPRGRFRRPTGTSWAEFKEGRRKAPPASRLPSGRGKKTPFALIAKIIITRRADAQLEPARRLESVNDEREQRIECTRSPVEKKRRWMNLQVESL